MSRISSEESTLQVLGELVARESVQQFLAGACVALKHQLSLEADAKSTQSPIPLSIYGDGLPDDVRSSWVFVLRPGYAHPAERHPNSIQRMFAFAGEGAMEVWNDDEWALCPLAPSPAPGLSIPELTWHRPAQLQHVWGVVSFHTVPADQLIEEVGEPQTGLIDGRRTYVAPGARMPGECVS